jgi:hypothetical protein
LLKIGSPDSGGYVKLTSKYFIGECEGGMSQFFLRLQSHSYGNMPSFKIVSYLLLGCIDSGGYVKFTQNYIKVGVKGAKIVAYLLLGCIDSEEYAKLTLKYIMVGMKGGGGGV